MGNLLDSVIEAHGGLARWRSVTDFVTDIDVRGTLCELSGWRGMVPQSRLLFSLRDQRGVILLPNDGGRIMTDPDRISLFDSHGVELASQLRPRHTLLLKGVGAEWDVLQTAHFMATVIRQIAAGPFLYSMPGFSTEELSPWIEGNEVWRALKVSYPPDLEVPFRSQVAYYGKDGLLRRIRSNSEVQGGLNLVEDVTAYDQSNGILVASSREVFSCEPSGTRSSKGSLAQIQLMDYFFAD